MAAPRVSVVCVTYKQEAPLRVFVSSFLNQTAHNWDLLVYHDGPDATFDAQMEALAAISEGRIRYGSTETRFNDYGHTLRDRGLKEIDGDYVLITNGDNYYVPTFIETITSIVQRSNPDVVMYDMVHSHNFPGGRRLPPYSYFQTGYSRNNIDMGAAVVRTELAKAVGFRDKTFAGDATYFEDIANLKGDDLVIWKQNQILFVHN